MFENLNKIQNKQKMYHNFREIKNKQTINHNSCSYLKENFKIR